mgnify:CR=1 FL=1
MYSMPKIVEKSNTESNTEIDSLKIRIPTDKIQITDSKLIGTKITILEETAEVLREFKDNALKFSNNGISTRFAIETMPIDSRGRTVEFLTILVNSKLLKSRYLEGITKENIREVYNEIQNYNVVKFSFAAFMQGACTDIDFKTDTRLTIPLFTDDNIKNYNEIKNLHDFFAKSFLKLANEYDESITHAEILERMEQTTGRLPFMRNGDYKGLHCHSGASMVAVYYLDCVDNDKDGGKLIFHDPAFNQVIKTRPKSKMSIETEKNTIIIVPAHVWHEVTPYYGEEDRLAVVMNISFPYR